MVISLFLKRNTIMGEVIKFIEAREQLARDLFNTGRITKVELRIRLNEIRRIKDFILRHVC